MHKKGSGHLWLSVFLIVTFLLPGSAAAVPSAARPPAVSPGPAIETVPPGAQLKPTPVSVRSKVARSDRYGPTRNDPSLGVPKHAYSPFDRHDEVDPCAGGRCQAAKGHVLVKLAADTQLRPQGLKGAWTTRAELNQSLLSQGILRLQPIFPTARRPRANAFVESPLGERRPMPDLTRWHLAVLSDEEEDVKSVAEVLRDAPGITWAEPDYLRKPVGGVETRDAVSLPAANSTLLSLPGSGTDPLYDQQWHLDAANIPAAWAYLEGEGLSPGGDRDIVVAVIDTGVDYAHPDLAANMWVNAAEFSGTPGVDDDGNGYVDDIYGADTVYPDGDPQDDHGHGTHVAGIIAAQANNGVGGVGVAYNVQLMALKAAQYSGVLASSDIAEAIYYAVEKGADVINMSFGGYARSQVEEDALAVAYGQAVLVAAAGNDAKPNLPCPNGRDMYPAAYNWVLGVMASTSGGGLAGFSNYDCIAHDSHEYELMAPGVDVWSTLPVENYAAWDGTSMSAPIVSGIAALARTKWSDKAVHSSRFIMGQIAANTSGEVADAYAALTVMPQPELRYLEHWLFDTEEQSPDNDDDGIVDAGETVDLAIVIRNHWGKADPVTVTLEAWAEGAAFPDPYVTMITDTVSYGAIGSFNWDDNGLIYDDEGVITGVRHPFRFTVPITTPNDHVIPFLLTMTADNGYYPGDPNAPYVFQSRFYLIVQRGTELPRIMSEDMVLTKDYFWLVPDQILIEPGVTVTVSEGTQIQFWSAEPDDPYHQNPNPIWHVEGSLIVRGSQTAPVEMFPGLAYPSAPVTILRKVPQAYVEVEYARVMNAMLGQYLTYVSNPIDHVDHAYFTVASPECVAPPNHWCWHSQVAANSVTNTRFRNISGRGKHCEAPLLHYPAGNLYDSCFIGLPGGGENNVFLIGFTGEPREGYVSFGQNVGYACTGCDLSTGRQMNPFKYNAVLSRLWDPDISHWMRIYAPPDRSVTVYLCDVFWGTDSPELLAQVFHDFDDDFTLAHYIYQPILTTPVTTTYPFVWDVVLSTASDPDASIVSAEPVTFTVTFNRDMDTSVQPAVSFGPDVPMTDYTIHPIDGGWQDLCTWVGTFNVNPITGDGYQLIRVANAVAADDPWLVTGDDAGRFRFEIITSGTEAMNLQATGGEGYVDLMWTQDDFDLLAGFNLYRATSADGTYARINGSIIPPEQRAYRDTDVQPGQPYYYKFTVVKSDMTESGYSNVATATPTDTIPPVINHTTVTSAPPGMPLTIFADVTDNVGVQGVILYYRQTGESSYVSKAMAHTTGDRYSATLEGSLLTSPGLDYYIEASDGVSTVQDGRPEFPHVVTVVDRPLVTSVTPDHGPTAGGTTVTIAGSNFKAGASVTLGGAVASNVTVVSSSQITCTTPAHFPETVDVTVTNPDSQSGTLLQAYTYESDIASLGLPAASGGQTDIVQIPVNAANIEGLAAADLTITFDSGVLSGQGASTGTLIPGWSIAVNTDTPGQVRLSMASSGGTASGAGTLATIEFEVVGSPGVTTALHFDSVSLNDGAISADASDGSFQVDEVYDVSGTVRYWSDSAGVPDVLLSLAGDRAYAGTSAADGTYSVNSVREGAYTLTPSKGDDANGISAYDASLVLQHAVGSSTLSGHAATAADVNKSGSITSMDAFYILQKAVDLIALPFPGAGVVWEFDPPNRSYVDLSADQMSQDFTAVLLGDPSGNWTASVGLAGARLRSGSATLSLPDVAAVPGQELGIPLDLALSGAQLYAADLTLTYDQGVVSALRVDQGALASGWSIATNLSTPGVVRVAVAGSTPITTSGEFLHFVFDVIGADGSESDLNLARGDLNEGGVAASLGDGHVNVRAPGLFAPTQRWSRQYRGFNSQDQYPRLAADVDGDGDADVVAFHPNKGVWVSLSTGNAYASKSLWSTVYKTWASQDALPRAVGDVDADGYADIAGFQPSKGIFVCLSNGADGFGARKLWSKQFRGWNSQNQYPRMLADVDGDGDADAVGLHPGKGVFVALSNGASGFASRTLWSKQFRGWNTQEQFPRMLGDIDGDGDADIVGFHPSKGVYVALSNGVDGFALRQRWSTEFTDCTSQEAKPRMLADVDGDGYADIVAFKPDGVYVALSTGTSFAKSVRWSEDYGDYASQDTRPRALGDANGDGKADIVGFDPTKGVYVALSSTQP